MLFKDLDIFLSAARAILQGIDPYSLPNTEVFYPLPFYFLFIPLAGLPPTFVHVFWTALQLGVLLALFRRRVLAVMLSVVVLLNLILGQVDIIWLSFLALLRSGIAGGLALAFLVLKPQLALLLAPWQLWQWWRHNRRQFWLFLAVLGLILMLSFVVQPDWIMRLLARSGERMRGAKSSSLWGLLSLLPDPWWLVSAVLLTSVLVIWAWRRGDFDLVTTTGLFLSPFIFSYNLMPVLFLVRDSRRLLGLAALSWLTFAIAAWQENDRAAALLTLLALWALVRTGQTQRYSYAHTHFS